MEVFNYLKMNAEKRPCGLLTDLSILWYLMVSYINHDLYGAEAPYNGLMICWPGPHTRWVTAGPPEPEPDELSCFLGRPLLV